MIDDRAIIDPRAKIAQGVSIGPCSVIGPDVSIGEGTRIGPHVVIQGETSIGKNNKIFQFSSLGDEPQDSTYQGEKTSLSIGDNNVIREYCMISRGTAKGGGITSIGNDNLFMAYSHIGHDAVVHNNTILVNYSAISGHVTLHDHAIVGAYAAVHQFCHVGSYAFITRATYISKDVLPYLMISGPDASACGINTVGLRRNGFSSASIDMLRRAYKLIFRKGLTVQQSLVELEKMVSECQEVVPMIEALKRSTRGVVR